MWTPSRRFGIAQGHKVRNIDDLSEFSINQCYGPGEKLDLGGIDEVVSLAAAWMRVHGSQDERVRVHPRTEAMQSLQCLIPVTTV